MIAIYIYIYIYIYRPLVQAAEIGCNIASSKSQTTHITLAMRHNLYVRDNQINSIQFISLFIDPFQGVNHKDVESNHRVH
jgi:hypothetical protein